MGEKKEEKFEGKGIVRNVKNEEKEEKYSDRDLRGRKEDRNTKICMLPTIILTFTEHKEIQH